MEGNIYQRIQAVSNEVRTIEKNLVVGSKSNSYKAVGDLDVTLAVKDAEKKYGLVSIPVKQELVKSDIIKVAGRDGETYKYVDVIKMTLKIINIDNPDEIVEVESFGRGLDPGDKGFGKASTYARKYALLNAYKIATGEDPDAEKSKDDKVVGMDEKRALVINALYNDVEKYQKTMKSFGHDSVEELTDGEIEKLYDGMKKRGML